jgi:hypothetical protein
MKVALRSPWLPHWSVGREEKGGWSAFSSLDRSENREQRSNHCHMGTSKIVLSETF